MLSPLKHEGGVFVWYRCLMWNNIRKLAHHRRGKWKGFVSKQNVLKAMPFVCDCWYGVSFQIWGLQARILQWFLPRIAWSDDSCHDRPSEVHFPRCGGLQAALQASPSFAWSSHNMPSPMAVGKLLDTKVGLFRMITFLLPPRGLPHFSNGTKNGHSKWWNLLWLWGYGEKEVVVRSLSLLFLLPNSWNKVYRL